MAKIVVLSYLPIDPANGGGRVRIRQLATHLALRHTVTMICPPLEGRPATPPPFLVHEIGVRGARQLIDPFLYRRIIDTVRQERPDVLLAEYIWQGLHGIVARFAHQATLVLDAFDVATVRFRQAGSRLWPFISAYERAILRRVDRVLAVSEIDRTRLLNMGAPRNNTYVIPNGVDTTEFRPDLAAGRRVREQLGIDDGDRLLLFFGQLDYPANADAVRTLARDVMPRLDARYKLAIAGRGANGLRERYENGQMRFLGPVEPLPAYINAADAIVAPIAHGSGTRLKLLESLACGTPTIATSVAAEGIDLNVCNGALTIADNWQAFAAAVREAPAHQTLPSSAFVAAYNWKYIAERFPA